MQKQDKQGVRTPSDLERKYNFEASTNAEKNLAKLSRQVSQLSTLVTQYMSATNLAIAGIRSDMEKSFKKFHPEAYTFTVTNTLTNCTTSNGAETVTGGTAYSAVITCGEGMVFDSVNVVMDGENVTESVCQITDNVSAAVSIPRVMGDIVITAAAVAEEGGEGT